MKQLIKKQAAIHFGSYSKFSEIHLNKNLDKWIKGLENAIEKYNKKLNMIGLEIIIKKIKKNEKESI